MNPSIRVKLIFSIDGAVADLALRDINLILFQFGVPDFDFDGDWREGILHRLGSASDEQLIGMAAHFGLSIPEAPPPAQTALNEADRLWEPECFRLFISHTHSNKELAGQIKRELLLRGISCFVAHDDIEPTKSWERELLLGLKSMDGLLAILSDDFRVSKWTDQEVGAAIVRSLPIVTLSMNSLLPYGFIGHIQALRRAKIAPSMGAKTLLDNFMKTSARPKIIRGAISRLCAASNYASATMAAEVVGADESLEPPLLQKIFDAACTNNQILPAKHVSEKISAIFNGNGFKPNVKGPAQRFMELPIYRQDADIADFLRSFGAQIPEKGTPSVDDDEIPF